jgi:IS5 family transposase
LGEVETLLADTGYFSTANVEACEKAGIEPLIAMAVNRIIHRCKNASRHRRPRQKIRRRSRRWRIRSASQ